MKKDYYIQVNDDMMPIKISLTDDEAITTMKVLKELAEGTDHEILVDISDEFNNELYNNMDKWSSKHEYLLTK